MSQLSLFAEWEDKVELPKLPRDLVTPSIKPMSDNIREVIDQIRDAYLDITNQSPWVIASSFGKDSTLLCLCIWIALTEISPDLRTRPVYVITSDTGLENPGLKSYVHESIEKMKESAAEQGLDCLTALVVMPDMKNRFGPKVIGHGVPLSTPVSPFRWCTDSFKIAPTELFVKGIIAEYGEVVIFTGVRFDESQHRATSILRNSDGKSDFIFPKTRVKKGKDGSESREIVKGRYECNPIKNITQDELWDALMKYSTFPWKTRFMRLYSLYKDSGECPMQIGEMKQSCGTSRNGCVICQFVKDDHMLQYFQDRGEEWADPIMKLRTVMRRMLYDANMREPIRKRRILKLDAVNPFTEQSPNEGQLSLQDLLAAEDGKYSDVPYEPLCIGGKPANPDLALASFSLEGRIFLLKNVLFYQREAGMELVTDDDLEYIKRVWTEEMGWDGNPGDLIPEPVPYFGGLVLNKEYEVNVGETTIPNLVVDSQYYRLEETAASKAIADEMFDFRRHLDLDKLKILNRTNDVDWDKLNFVYYVTTDFGGSETEIHECIDKSKRATGTSVPFVWHPVVSSEKGRNVYWNNVTFVVSRSSVRSLADARQFVEYFLDAGVQKPAVENYDWEQGFWKHYVHGRTLFEARRTILRVGFHPKQVPDAVKEYANLSEEILMVAYAIKSSVGDGFTRMTADKAYEICSASAYWDEVIWTLLYDERSPEAVKKVLIEKGYIPQVIPETVKFYAELSDIELYFGNRIRVNGKRECLTALFLMPDTHNRLPLFMREALDAFIEELRAIPDTEIA
jgi:DNA sulfur modification protein DndC